MVLARGKWKRKMKPRMKNEVWVKRRRRTRTVEWENMRVFKNWLWMKHVKDDLVSLLRVHSRAGSYLQVHRARHVYRARSTIHIGTSVSRNFGRFHFNQKVRIEFSATSSTSELMAQHFPNFLKVGQPCGVYPIFGNFFPEVFFPFNFLVAPRISRIFGW